MFFFFCCCCCFFRNFKWVSTPPPTPQKKNKTKKKKEKKTAYLRYCYPAKPVGNGRKRQLQSTKKKKKKKKKKESKTGNSSLCCWKRSGCSISVISRNDVNTEGRPSDKDPITETNFSLVSILQHCLFVDNHTGVVTHIAYTVFTLSIETESLRKQCRTQSTLYATYPTVFEPEDLLRRNSGIIFLVFP